MYDCKRSATVISENYSTLAKFNKTNFKEIMREF